MPKSYADLMNEISADELYERLLAYGLFADKLPPIFSSVDFYHYCQNKAPHFLIIGNSISIMRVCATSMFLDHWVSLTPWLIKSYAVVFQITGII